MTALIFAGIPVALLVLGMPIFIVLLAATAFGILHTQVGPLTAIHTAVFGGLDSFPLLAIPLFVFAGEIMARGGIAQRLIEMIFAIIGGVRGSLGIATVGSAAAFGAMSGSSVACVAAIGKLTVPSLQEAGYGRNFAVSLVTVTGVIDVIIPPSIPMIIYAVAAQQSVTLLFLAGIVPGLIIAAVLAIYVVVRAKTLDIPVGPRPRIKTIVAAVRNAAWSIFAPVLILGGIYGGAFTPTEAAGIACLYAIFVSYVIYRTLTLADIWQLALDSALLVAQIMVLVAAAGAYGWLIATSGFPTLLVDYISQLGLEVWLLLLVINVVLLFVGSVLEPPAAILVLTPLLMPLIAKAGIDPIHFGLVLTINLAIGMFLPPFGLNLFASHAIFRVPFPVLYRGVVPFVLLYGAVLVLITYVPAIVMTPLGWFR